MKTKLLLSVAALAAGCLCLPATGQENNPPPQRDGARPGPGGPRQGGGGFPGGFPGGGPGGMMGQAETKLVDKFDADGNGRLEADERKAARESLAKDRAEGRGAGRGPGGRGGMGGMGGFGGGAQEPLKPGIPLTSADVKAYGDEPFYDAGVLRTLFLQFENADWEKELADFNNTDVDVPATLTVDGRTYKDVGVRFRGMSSYFTVGEGRKRSLNLSIDHAVKDQNVGGYRTLNLLNAHSDPSFLRTVLTAEISRHYVPTPKANFVRVVINGENWGVYPSAQQFNKDFVNEWFGTTKGARWKVPGSPNGRGSLAYLGDDPAAYKSIYEIKTKDDDKSWARLIQLTKTLNQTPPEKLVEALSPLLDIDGALKFLALENVLINNDGYWVRTSDYNLYLDEKGRFHLIPHDMNETFSMPGGPGFGGGGPGGPGGPGGFGPGMFLAPQFLAQADKDADGKVSKTEFAALAETWFAALDPDKTGQVRREGFVAKLGDLLPPPQGFGGGPGGPGGFGPATFIGPGLFTALDTDKDGVLTRDELKGTFGCWFTEWGAGKDDGLEEGALLAGLNTALPSPVGGGPGGPGVGPRGPGGPAGGGRGPRGGGMGGGPAVRGVELDPLAAANDPDKVLIAKLLAVPELRARYLGFVRDIAQTWLDWEKLGPIARRYHELIADDVKRDTRKLDSFEQFTQALGESGGTGSRGIALKAFAEQRRAYLLNHPEIRKLAGQ